MFIASLKTVNSQAFGKKHTKEYCAMYDICGERSDGKVLNCPYGSEAVKVASALWLQ
jgi:Niemann-Pick C1 protein